MPRQFIKNCQKKFLCSGELGERMKAVGLLLICIALCNGCPLEDKIADLIDTMKANCYMSDDSITQLMISIDDMIAEAVATNGGGSGGVAGPRGPPGPPGPPGKDTTGGGGGGGGGGIYTRWARNGCGADSTHLYSGYMSSSYFTNEGGGTNFQCMPTDVEYNSGSTVTTYASMYGTEFETYSFGVFPNDAYDNNPPCSVCYTNNRPAVLMIPAMRTCPYGWTEEYEGYLMAGHPGQTHQSTFECVDAEPEYVAGQSANTNGALLYFTIMDCYTGIPCPPYNFNLALTCVVCSK
ncbi:short-chain collagen C4-like [Watersipora subatra]|uniref:short-chain collagen C4-like n=1 Tax=Watersipora subatra TaxID=2589382 RepID=UPI00355C1F1C